MALYRRQSTVTTMLLVAALFAVRLTYFCTDGAHPATSSRSGTRLSTPHSTVIGTEDTSDLAPSLLAQMTAVALAPVSWR